MSQTTVKEFLGLQQTNTVRMCLPQFEGMVATDDGLTYRGNVHANRDINAALHISELAFEAGAEISYIAPHEGEDVARASTGTLVMFGSRSNVATNAFMARDGREDIVRFEYGDEWVIRTKSGHRYALPDPSTLDRNAYANFTDYGVVAIYNYKDMTSIVVAGLGGRATEGCGLFLRDQWQELARQSRGSRVFATILKFAPPVDPGRYEIAEFIAA